MRLLHWFYEVSIVESLIEFHEIIFAVVQFAVMHTNLIMFCIVSKYILWQSSADVNSNCWIEKKKTEFSLKATILPRRKSRHEHRKAPQCGWLTKENSIWFWFFLSPSANLVTFTKIAFHIQFYGNFSFFFLSAPQANPSEKINCYSKIYTYIVQCYSCNIRSFFCNPVKSSQTSKKRHNDHSECRCSEWILNEGERNWKTRKLTDINLISDFSNQITPIIISTTFMIVI